LIFVIVTGCVLFEVRTEFLNIISRSFSFKRLIREVKYKGNVVFAVSHQIMKACLGNGGPAPSIRLWIEANDQPHASLALHPVKEPAVAV
jgi:hypothetical protein